MSIIKDTGEHIKSWPKEIWPILGTLFIGLIISIILSGKNILLLITFIAGIILANKKSIEPRINLEFLFYAGIFLLGLMIFSGSVSKTLLMLLYVIGIYIGFEIKKRY